MLSERAGRAGESITTALTNSPAAARTARSLIGNLSRAQDAAERSCEKARLLSKQSSVQAAPGSCKFIRPLLATRRLAPGGNAGRWHEHYHACREVASGGGRVMFCPKCS